MAGVLERETDFANASGERAQSATLPAAHQAVAHVHFHIIPKTGAGGLGIHWPAGRLDAATATQLQKRIRAALVADAGSAGDPNDG